MNVDEIGGRLCASCLRIGVLVLCTIAFDAFGETWYFDSSKNYDTYTEANGNTALGNLSYWTNSLGQAGSGAPGTGDNLVFDSSVRGRLRLSATAYNNFAGDSLQVGSAKVGQTLVYSGGNITASGYTLKLANAYMFCNANANRTVAFPVEILSETANKPAVICIGNTSYDGYTYEFTGAFSGSANAQLRFGHWTSKIGSDTPSCAARTTFQLSDISQYAGTITVTSKTANAAASFGTHLKIAGTQTSSAKLNIAPGGSLSMAAFGDALTVKELSLANGTRLWFNQASKAGGSLWCVKATDSLAVTGQVEVWLDGVTIFGAGSGGEQRIPILVGPSTSSFTESNFTLTLLGESFNENLHLEVAPDGTTGELTLYVVADSLIDQLSCYTDEGAKSGGADGNSSLTNAAAWRDGALPDPANIANGTYLNYHYYTTIGLRTKYEINTPYTFPAASLTVNGGSLIVQTHTFEVPELTVLSGSLGVGQHPGETPHFITAPHIHFPESGSIINLKSWSSATLILDGEIDGPGDLNIKGHGITGSPRALYGFTGLNTNFTGSITIRSDEYRPAYIDYSKGYTTFYLYDGRNLGGRKDEFDPRALTISHLAQVMVTNMNSTVTLEDGLNRGVYVWEKGRFNVSTAASTLDIKWPILLSGKMWKEGPGTLVLGKGLKHEVDDGGELSDVPRAGSNLFEIVAGTVKIAHADALAGVETTIDAGASIQLVLDSGNADLMKYGIRNTAVDAPFTLDASFGGKLPLTVDASAVPPPDGVTLTNGIVTVNATAAQTMGDMLPDFGRLWDGVSTKMVQVEDSGVVTFALVSKRIGTMFIVR